ncbi:hypothetical protein RCL_jg6522.t1 [Rhizophagus clarus]|uniref:Uncharacterized protein n=1 Tax=Rhizophagus clarus TaxID=94130 RepID=A0A8H3LBQ1_9GLOM|nr:hypothetical protein RCL_jg6522.t1 [Rhizophagus clarus]
MKVNSTNKIGDVQFMQKRVKTKVRKSWRNSYIEGSYNLKWTFSTELGLILWLLIEKFFNLHILKNFFPLSNLLIRDVSSTSQI